jgi:hypothetical protein
MKTTGLTWAQAENLLRTGMANLIEFDEGECHNIFYLLDGKLCSSFHEQIRGYVGDGYVPTSRTGFKVVDEPTQPTKLPEHLCKPKI